MRTGLRVYAAPTEALGKQNPTGVTGVVSYQTDQTNSFLPAIPQIYGLSLRY